MSIRIQRTTLGAVAARQSVITDPLRALLDAHGPDARCDAKWQDFAFGTYLASVEIIPDHICWADDTLCHECGGAA